MKYIFFSILTTLAILACNDKKTAPKLSLQCYVRYDEPGKAIKAEASMRDEDAKKVVEIPGGIRYQHMEMELAPAIGMTYRYEYTAQFVNEHVFDWNDEKNGKQQFKMTIDPITTFALGASTISNAKPNSIAWEGTPLGKGETMVFIWENAKNNMTIPMEVTTSSGQPFIDIPAEKLKGLTPGDWTLYLVRKKLTKEIVNGMPVNGIMEYYTKPISIKVTG